MDMILSVRISSDDPLFEHLKKIKEQGDLSCYVRDTLRSFIHCPPELIAIAQCKRDIAVASMIKDASQDNDN